MRYWCKALKEVMGQSRQSENLLYYFNAQFYMEDACALFNVLRLGASASEDVKVLYERIVKHFYATRTLDLADLACALSYPGFVYDNWATRFCSTMKAPWCRDNFNVVRVLLMILPQMAVKDLLSVLIKDVFVHDGEVVTEAKQKYCDTLFFCAKMRNCIREMSAFLKGLQPNSALFKCYLFQMLEALLFTGFSKISSTLRLEERVFNFKYLMQHFGDVVFLSGGKRIPVLEYFFDICSWGLESLSRKEQEAFSSCLWAYEKKGWLTDFHLEEVPKPLEMLEPVFATPVKQGLKRSAEKPPSPDTVSKVGFPSV